MLSLLNGMAVATHAATGLTNLIDVPDHANVRAQGASAATAMSDAQ